MTYALIALTVVVAVLGALAAVAGLFMLQTFIHEVCHCIAARYLGYEVVGFRPWLHHHDGKRWNGRTTVKGTVTHAGYFSAPMWFAFCEFAVLATLSITRWKLDGFWDALGWGMAAAALVDLGNWCVGLFRPKRYWLDAQRWRQLR